MLRPAAGRSHSAVDNPTHSLPVFACCTALLWLLLACREMLAAITGAEVDKLVETRGLDAVDAGNHTVPVIKS